VITRGQWKGYVGIVREATDSSLRIELHTNSKKISIPREGCRLKDQPMETDDHNKAPSWDPTRTPMREDVTATPMRVPGTPMRGLATPLRVPGTPVHGTAWDPSMPNTPMRPNSWDSDYNSSSSWTPNTPGTGYQNLTPYSPARPTSSSYDRTPDSTSSSHNPATPSSGLYTPMDQRTPTDSTPYGTSYNPSTPGTPGSHGPNTPTARAPATPQIPEESAAERSQWLSANVGVRITGDNFRNYKGYITEVFTDRGIPSCRVELTESPSDSSVSEVITVGADLVERVIPQKKDTVIIVGGEYKGLSGSLIGIDGGDGIVKTHANLDIKIVELHRLAKIRPDNKEKN